MAAPRYLRLNDTSKKKEEGLAIKSTAGVADAEKIVSTDDEGFIDPSFIRDSEVIIREASEALDARDFVNIWDDLGTAKARKADASAASTRAHGIVVDSFLSGANATIISEGKVGGFTGLTMGEPVFLSLTAGEITQTPPTAAGEIWQVLGHAISATEIRLEIGEVICRN